MDLKSSPRWEIGVAAFFILACALILFETRDIRPGTFEPLGSAPVPQATAILIIALSAVVALRGWRKLGAEGAVPAEADFSPRPLDAVAVAVLTVVYVTVLDTRLFDFAPLTAAYLFLTIAILTRLRLKSLAAAMVVSVVTGWGAQYIFTRIFVVDLPGL